MSAKMKNKNFSISRTLNRRVDNVAQLFAWIGTVSILAGYFFTTVGFLPQNDPIYHGLNFIGAIGLISITLPKKVYQSVFLNSIWAITAIVGIIKFLSR